MTQKTTKHLIDIGSHITRFHRKLDALMMTANQNPDAPRWRDAIIDTIDTVEMAYLGLYQINGEEPEMALCVEVAKLIREAKSTADTRRRLEQKVADASRETARPL